MTEEKIEEKNILLTVDYDQFDGYDNFTKVFHNYRFTDLIIREQQLLKDYLFKRFANRNLHDEFVILVNVNSEFGTRKPENYIVVMRGSDHYNQRIKGGDYQDIGSLEDYLTFFKHWTPPRRK